MPEHMPEDMPDRMPDRMPEDMSDRMPEDLPVRKCINAMVGIVRSEVIQYCVLLVTKFACMDPNGWNGSQETHGRCQVVDLSRWAV